MDILAPIITLIAGILIGIFVGNKIAKNQTLGRLRIDHSEPDEPARMFVELKGVTPDMIAKHKFVMFEVINESYLSRD